MKWNGSECVPLWAGERLQTSGTRYWRRWRSVWVSDGGRNKTSAAIHHSDDGCAPIERRFVPSFAHQVCFDRSRRVTELGQNSPPRVTQPVPLRSYRWMVEGFPCGNNMGITQSSPKSTRTACGFDVCTRFGSRSAWGVAARHRPDTVSRWLLQRVHILPPNFKDADTYRHDHQSRIGHGRWALAHSDQADSDGLPARADLLWHAVTNFPASAESTGSNKQTPVVATPSGDYQPRPLLWCEWRRDCP